MVRCDAATKLSTSLTAAEEQWREHFPRGAPKDDAEGDDEKLLNFFFCKLQLNVGDCPGTLFVTSAGLYFLSDNELEYNTDEDEVDTSHYRVRRTAGSHTVLEVTRGLEGDTEAHGSRFRAQHQWKEIHFLLARYGRQVPGCLRPLTLFRSHGELATRQWPSCQCPA